MARFVWTARISGASVANSGTDHTALMKIVAPANQKLAVRFRVWLRNASGQSPARFTVRQNSSDTGATLGDLTTTPTSGRQIAKMNAQDAETIQGTARYYSGQPTTKDETNGKIVEQFNVPPPLDGVSRTYQVNGGESLTLWGITATDASSVDIEATVEE